MPALLNPKTGSTIGYQETKGTTAEPFNVPMVWQSSTLSYISLQVDPLGNLLTNGGDYYAQKVTASGGASYIAVASAGSSQASAVWQVKKVYTSGSDTITVWANGNANFSNVATDLTILSYS